MTAKDIAHALTHVYDPELGIDIVSMGLIYGIIDEEDGVHVTMTTTFPGCPMGGAIAESVERALHAVRPGRPTTVTTTHDPPWDMAMLTAQARRHLGMD